MTGFHTVVEPLLLLLLLFIFFIYKFFSELPFFYHQLFLNFTSPTLLEVSVVSPP